MVRGRKKVTWTNPEQLSVKALQPHPYVTVRDLPEHLREEYDAALFVGSLWHVANRMFYEKPGECGYALHENSYVASLTRRTPPTASDILPGSIAVYMGTKRVEEEKRKGMTVRIDRHAFLIGGTVYLAVSLADFLPVI